MPNAPAVNNIAAADAMAGNKVGALAMPKRPTRDKASAGFAKNKAPTPRPTASVVPIKIRAGILFGMK